MQRLFDDYVMVDWSAASQPKNGKDSIWIGWGEAHNNRLEMHAPVNPKTRSDAIELVETTIRLSLELGRRVLVGFDFPFCYPAGLVASFPHIFGEDEVWRAVWTTLSRLITDDTRNRSNRFEVASEINREAGCRLFWGCPRSAQTQYLAENDKPIAGFEETGRRPAELRLTDSSARRFGTIQTCWKLFCGVSVGSQALLGIPRIEQLRREIREIRIWPFETGLGVDELGQVTIAEIWPTVFSPEPGCHPVPDAAQVMSCVEACFGVDGRGELAQWMAPPTALVNGGQVFEEGWILGVL